LALAQRLRRKVTWCRSTGVNGDRSAVLFRALAALGGASWTRRFFDR
jgi:hypothetical protein